MEQLNEQFLIESYKNHNIKHIHTFVHEAVSEIHSVNLLPVDEFLLRVRIQQYKYMLDGFNDYGFSPHSVQKILEIRRAIKELTDIMDGRLDLFEEK